MRNERTSKEVAKLAGEIMERNPPDRDEVVFFVGGSRQTETFKITGKQLKSMAASLMNQAADKPLRVAAKPKRSVKRAK